MDQRTIDTYDTYATDFASAFRRVVPSSIFGDVPAFFHPSEATADIGCGSGRDTAWLQELGFRVVGYDASRGMLEQARLVHPEIEFHQDNLPELATIPDGVYRNVLCTAVLMHLPSEEVPAAALTLSRILDSGGRLHLTYTYPRGTGDREDDGRLFMRIPPGTLQVLFEAAGFQVVRQFTRPDTERPGVQWTTFHAEKR